MQALTDVVKGRPILQERFARFNALLRENIARRQWTRILPNGSTSALACSGGIFSVQWLMRGMNFEASFRVPCKCFSA